jgi:hypothetical protein
MFAFFVTATVTIFRSFLFCHPACVCVVTKNACGNNIPFCVVVTTFGSFAHYCPLLAHMSTCCRKLHSMATIAFIHVRSIFADWEATVSPTPSRGLFKGLATACSSNKHARVHTQWHTRARTHTYLFRTPLRVLGSYLVHTFFNTNCGVLGRSV